MTCRTFHATDAALATIPERTVAFLVIFNDALDWYTASCFESPSKRSH
jgi:hypothetical protein